MFAILIFIGRYTKRSSPNRRMSARERRACPRHKTSLRIKYKTPLEEGVSWIRDISENGARLFLNKALKTLEIGKQLGIEISLPDDPQPILVRGNIVWSEEDSAGFNFQEVAQGDINRILAYINNRENPAVDQKNSL